MAQISSDIKIQTLQHITPHIKYIQGVSQTSSVSIPYLDQYCALIPFVTY